jgi:hypothetical protein
VTRFFASPGIIFSITVILAPKPYFISHLPFLLQHSAICLSAPAAIRFRLPVAGAELAPFSIEQKLVILTDLMYIVFQSQQSLIPPPG